MNYLETEIDQDHTEREGADETQTERRWCDSCKAYVTVEEGCCEHAVTTAPEMLTLICSCGFRTCPLVVRYGLSEPTWTAVIQPIQSQWVRDTTAEEIKMAGGI